MASPTTSVLDDFNRTSLGANWSAMAAGGSGVSIVDNQLAGGSSTRGVYWNPSSFDASLTGIEAFCTLPSFPSNTNVGIFMTQHPLSVGWDGYWFFYNNGTGVFSLFRVDGGGVTTLDTGGGFAAGDKLLATLAPNGDLVASRFNSGTWTEIAGATDTTYQLGFFIGVRGSNGWRADDFGGGETVVSTTVTGAASLTGTGTLTATGTRTVSGSAAFAGAGALAAAGTRETFGAASLTGAGSLLARIPTETPQTLPGGAPAVVKAPRPVHVDDDEDALALILALAT